MKQEKFSVIYESTQNLWFAGNPVQVQKLQLLLDNELNQEFLVCELLNCSEGVISAAYVDVICYGEGGIILTAVKDAKISEIYALPHAVFGIDSPIKLPVSNAVSVKVTVSKVNFADGEVWRHQGGGGRLLEKAKLCELPGALMAQFELECKKENLKSRYKFEEFNDYWNCTCSTHNEADRDECVLCGAKRDWLRKHSDPAYLSAALEERLTAEKNEKIRKNRENTYLNAISLAERSTEADLKKAAQMMQSVEGYKDSAQKAEEYLKAADVIHLQNIKKRRRNTVIISAVSVVIALVIAAVLTYIFYFVPKTNYQSAESFLASGEYDRAKDIFISIGSFSDAPERVKECDYQKATQLLIKKDYQAAKPIFEGVSDYSDAAVKANECEYQLAIIKLNGSDLEAAKQMFLGLKDYLDSSTLAAECDYRKAMELKNAEDYKGAIELFEGILSYSDSLEQQKDAKYRYAQKNYNNTDLVTVQYLSELKAAGYKDAQTLLAALSSWDVKIIYNDSKTDLEKSLISVSIKKDRYFHVTVTGGLPNQSVNLRWEVTVHKTLTGVIENVTDGSTVTFGWDAGDKGYTAGSGDLTVRIYDNDTNELLGVKTNIYVSQK